MSLTQKTLKGVAWSGFSAAMMTALSLAITTILARLLSPEDFGLMGIVMIVANFAFMISDLGLSAAVIQSEELNEEQLSTFFFLNLGVGVFLCLTCYLSSGYLAVFFDREELAVLLKVIGLSFLIASFSQIFLVLFQKSMEFKTLFQVEVVSNIIYGIAAISLALSGFGVWSLVLGVLVKQTASLLQLLIRSPFKPRLSFSLRSVRKLLSFGVYVSGERFLNYFNRNLDNIIIGRFLGAEALGFYLLAYNLMLFPVVKIAGTVTQVIFPAFSKIKGDNAKLRAGYLKAIAYISMVTFPLMAILFATAPEFINLVYGPKWHVSIPVLKVFCFVGMLQSIGTTVGSVLYAKGRADIAFKWNCCVVGCFAVAFFVGLRWGVLGVAVTYGVVSLLLSPIIQSITNRLIGLLWKDFFNRLWHQAVAALLSIFSILTLKSGLAHAGVSSWALLVSSVTLGSAVYIAFLYWTEKDGLLEEFKSLSARPLAIHHADE